MVEVPTQRVTLARALLITLVSGVAVAAPRLVQLAARFGPSPLTVRLDAGVADSESTVVVLASNYCFCNRAMSIADPLSSSFVAVRRTEPGFPSSTQTWVLNQPRAGTREVTVSTSTTSDMAVVVLEYRGLAANSVADSGATVTASTSQVTTPTLVVEDGGLVLGFAWDQTSFGVPDAWTVEGLDGSAQKLTVFGSASAGCTMVVAHALAPPSRERFTFRRNDGVSSGGLHGVLLSLRAGPEATGADGGLTSDAGADDFDGGSTDGGFTEPAGARHYRVGCDSNATRLHWFAALLLLGLRRLRVSSPSRRP